MSLVSTLLEIYHFDVPRLILNGRAAESIRHRNRALVIYLATNKQRISRDIPQAFSGLTMSSSPPKKNPLIPAITQKVSLTNNVTVLNPGRYG